MRLISILAVASLALSTACAKDPASVTAAPVSPALYAGYSCAQLNAEAQRINARLSQLTGQQQAASNADAGMMAVSLILFWPAIFAVGGSDQSAALAQVKGEAQALQQAAVTACNR